MLHNSEKDFIKRHIGPSKKDEKDMLGQLGYQNINELYEFKKTLQDKKIILPILKESEQSKKSITFTPINPSDLITLDGLLPPKSTWITPRL